MLKEFKTFVMRGNVIDLAVGIVIGAAFTAVVNSLVKDVLMPPIGLLLGNADFSNLFVSLNGTQYANLAAAQAAGAPTINYGVFINTIISFLIVALAIFFVVKAINTLQRPAPQPVVAPTTKTCPYCSMTIPITARRCPECTTVLEGQVPAIAD